MKFQAIPTTSGPATFFEPGEPVVERHWNRKRLQILMPDGPRLYVRLQPARYSGLLSPEDAARLAVSARIEPMRRSAGALGYSAENNTYGAVVFHCSSELECLCLTQLHWNFEMWGIDAHHLGTDHEGKGHRPHISVTAVEEVFTYTLNNFLSAAGRLGLESPLRLECGLTEVEGYGMAANCHTVAGNVVERNLVWDTTINGYDDDAGSCLLPFFEFLWRRCGLSRAKSP